MYTKKIFHSHRRQKTGLKWAYQLITQIWRLVYGQWINRSKLNHTEEAFDNHSKELILSDEIIDEHKQVQDTLPNLYNPYFGTPLSIILDTSITSIKIVTA